MRVSSFQIHTQASEQLQTLGAQTALTQQQIGEGKKLVRPGDDHWKSAGWSVQEQGPVAAIVRDWIGEALVIRRRPSCHHRIEGVRQGGL